MRENQAMSPCLQPPHRVVVIALPGVFPFELGIPGRTFGSAAGPDGRPLYDVVTCSIDGRPVPTGGDFDVMVHHDLDVVRHANTVIIPPACAEAVSAAELDALAAALHERHRQARLASFCTGAHVLAHAGLLDDRPAATHWRDVDDLQRLHPTVRVDPDVLYIDDGDLLTGAGAAAGIDLCLHLIRRDHGADVANHVARLCVVPPHRDGGQAQYIDHPIPEPSGSSTAETRNWALQHLDEQLTLAVLAERSGMSVRTFSRRFREEVGTSPNQWLTQQRLELARRLLETTDLPIDHVAERAGLGTAASLRSHLSATIGVSPTAYRRTFRVPGEPVQRAIV